MGGGGSNASAASNKPSWQTGSLNTKPISAEDFNEGLLGDAQYSYLQGPAQENFVGMGAGTKNAIADMTSAANSNAGLLSNAADSTSGALDYYQGVMSGGDSDPAFQRLKQNAIDEARTATNRQFNTSGRFGSSLHAQDVTEGIANASAGMDYRNLARQDAAAGNVVSTAAQMPSMYQAQLMPSQTTLQAQGLLDADAQAAASFDPNYNHLAKYQALTNENAAGPQPAQQPGFMDYAGLGIGALGALSPFMLSDERAKDNIQKVGTTDDGMPIMTYRYKGDTSGKTHMGLLAQDVQKKKPEAVANVGGLLAVDYGKIA